MKLIYNLEENTNRPIIRLDDLFKGCNALLDTGAIFPLWTKDKFLLIALGAKLYRTNVSFTGFGGTTKGDVYIINLKFGSIYYPRLQIMACKNDKIPGYFIFSATMFQKMSYTIDNITKKLYIVTPDNQLCYNLSILDSNGKIHVLCTNFTNTEKTDL